MIAIVNKEAHESANHWADLAKEADERAAYDEQELGPGHSSAPLRHKAALYRRVAEALRREAVTGKPHCHACMGPHPAHEHPRRHRN